MWMIVFVLAAALSTGLQMGCATPYAGSQLPSTPVVEAASFNASEPAAYRIQSGDVLAVRFFNNPEFSQDATVRPDGKIALPYIDEVQVAGLTPAEVDAVVTDRFRKVLLRPEITIVVNTFAGQRVYVGGEVSQPGLVELTGRTTALQAILSAGGFLDTARMSQVLLIRRGRDNWHAGQALNLQHVLKGGQSSQDVTLQPLDVVYVPKTRIAKVNQFVDQYIRRLVPVPRGGGLSIP